MAFVQIIEFSSNHPEEIRALVEEFQASRQGTMTGTRGTACADRDHPNRFITVVEFPSYEEAMKNSESPETSKFAARMAELCDGPPTFRNLDVIETFQG